MTAWADDIPAHVTDDEMLHRRIIPIHCKPDGTISSAAFNDFELSVDRASYRNSSESLAAHPHCGLAGIVTLAARELGQVVAADKILLNQSHALVKGKKTKSIARKLAQFASFVVPVPLSTD